MKEGETHERKKPRLTCRFFVTDAGNEPVRKWLKDLDADAQKTPKRDLDLGRKRQKQVKEDP